MRQLTKKKSEMSTLVIGDYRHTLTIVRALGRTGQNVILAYSEDGHLSRYSRFTDEIWPCPKPGEDPVGFRDALQQLLQRRPDIDSLLPVGEIEIRWILAHGHCIPANVKVLAADFGSTRRCLDKADVAAIVDRLEIPQPAREIAESPAALSAVAKSIGFPCVAKLLDSRSLLFGRKAIIIWNEATLQAEFKNCLFESGPVMLQKFVQGTRINVYFFAHEGQLVSLGQTAIALTDRNDGTGLSIAGQTITPHAVVTKYCAQMVAELKVSGPGCMQFILEDGTDSLWFLEHNPRLGASLALVHGAGLNLPKLMLDFANGCTHCNDQQMFPCRSGVRFVWTAGAISGLKRQQIGDLRNDDSLARRWLHLCWRSIVAPVHVTWLRSDPLPAFYQLARFAQKLLRRAT